MNKAQTSSAACTLRKRTITWKEVSDTAKEYGKRGSENGDQAVQCGKKGVELFDSLNTLF